MTEIADFSSCRYNVLMRCGSFASYQYSYTSRDWRIEAMERGEMEGKLWATKEITVGPSGVRNLITHKGRAISMCFSGLEVYI